MPAQTIEVQQEQPVAVYGPAVITVEVDNKYAVSLDTIRLTVCYRDVDYCDLSVGDAKALIAALQAAVTEVELQTPKQCYRCGLDATPGQTEGWALNRKANGAGWHCAECTDQVTVQWIGPQGDARCSIAKCGGCERPVAFSEASEMTDAGWKLADGRWRCPACLAKSAPPQVVNCHQCQVAIATWSTRQMFDAGWNIGAGRYWYCPACKDAP